MNNRPIKFRTWLESENRFLDNKEIAETLIKFHLPDNKITSQPLIHVALLLGSRALGWTFQQFTGLKDSTGREIYEGDIVSFQYRNEGLFSGLIAFDDMYLGFSLQKTKAFYGNIQLSFSSSRDLKIIGNIFETPELLA